MEWVKCPECKGKRVVQPDKKKIPFTCHTCRGDGELLRITLQEIEILTVALMHFDKSTPEQIYFSARADIGLFGVPVVILRAIINKRYPKGRKITAKFLRGLARLVRLGKIETERYEGAWTHYRYAVQRSFLW